jgi:hypothetical protein
MDHESLSQIERQVAAVQMSGAPDALRATILSQTRGELRAARWDRRLARAAVLLLVVGICLNAAMAWQATVPRAGTRPQVVQSGQRQSLVDTAVVIAEATDAATGSRFARQLAAMSGRELTTDEAAAVDAAVRHVDSHGRSNGNKG